LFGFDAFKAGTVDGDTRRGVLPLAQIGGIIRDIPTVAEVMERIVREADAARLSLDTKLEGPDTP
jgi:NAD(P)H-dependent flavin oxidoreductase YrpB (nitropropane dioxygenase family)